MQATKHALRGWCDDMQDIQHLPPHSCDAPRARHWSPRLAAGAPLLPLAAAGGRPPCEARATRHRRGLFFPSPFVVVAAQFSSLAARGAVSSGAPGSGDVWIRWLLGWEAVVAAVRSGSAKSGS
uniref:Uncharacterized protein n=1 Tax=Aegilops tauschii subsp. strangulata TaxID=200361 RepID=A0A453K929_AEGTS